MSNNIVEKNERLQKESKFIEVSDNYKNSLHDRKSFPRIRIHLRIRRIRSDTPIFITKYFFKIKKLFLQN